MEKPIARIYAIGTPAVWWLAAAAPTLFVCWVTTRLLLPAAHTTATTTEDVKEEEGEAAAEEDDADAAAPPPSPPPLGSLATRGTLLLLGYLANWLPFIPVKRAAFLYHFLPALVHALLLLGVLLDIAIPSNLPILHTRSNPTDSRLLEQILPSTGGILASGLNAPSGGRWLVSSALIYLMASCFAYFAPLAYGMPLSHEEFDARMWLEGWR